MTVKERRRLKKQQKELMQRRDICEHIQTEHSDDMEFFRYCQNIMDKLNEDADQIRLILEKGCC